MSAVNQDKPGSMQRTLHLAQGSELEAAAADAIKSIPVLEKIRSMSDGLDKVVWGGAFVAAMAGATTIASNGEAAPIITALGLVAAAGVIQFIRSERENALLLADITPPRYGTGPQAIERKKESISHRARVAMSRAAIVTVLAASVLAHGNTVNEHRNEAYRKDQPAILVKALSQPGAAVTPVTSKTGYITGILVRHKLPNGKMSAPEAYSADADMLNKVSAQVNSGLSR
jgi:hypothetical protein